MLPNRPLHACCLSLGLLIAGQAGLANQPRSVECSRDRAIFLTDQGAQIVDVEIADDPQERAQGLMYRRSLADNRGMLFIFETPRETSFWMRNTYLPLDLVFLDPRGVIRHIHRNARPLDETPIPGASAKDPDPLRLMVLEVRAGEADRLGLAVGQPMAHPGLDQNRAALACN